MPVQFGVMKAIKLLSSNDIVLSSVVIQMARKSSTLLWKCYYAVQRTFYVLSLGMKS